MKMNNEDLTLSEMCNSSTPLQRRRSWRPLVSYWLLGLCNNYGYVVMLSAAYDILKQLNGDNNSHHDDNAMKNSTNDVRVCNSISTGAILLADIVPSLVIKLTAPFLPFYIHIRVALCVLMAAAGFFIVAFANAEWQAIVGVAATSIASGLGEVSFLQYSAFYDKNVISTWSSGTGAAGILGSLSYAGLSELGFKTALLIMLIIPTVMAFSFWMILPSPEPENMQCVLEMRMQQTSTPKQSVYRTLQRKFELIPTFFKYMIPLTSVYFFEYFINQGLFELITFDNIFLTYEHQYHWLQVLYQIGVFLSRSSVNILHVEQIWLMSILQLFNVIIYTFDAIFYYIPSIWIVFALTLWEGMLGGAAYVNTYYRISQQVPDDIKQFALSITAISDTIGVTLAGIAAIPAHDVICSLPKPNRQHF